MYRRVTFEPQAFLDYTDWQESTFSRVSLVGSLMFDAIQMLIQHGVSEKSTAVTYESMDAWSLKIWRKHHLIYQINDEEIRILSCRYRKPYVV